MGFFSGAKSKTKQVPVISGEQIQAIKSLIPQLQQRAEEGVDLPSIIPELSNLESLSLAGLENLARGEAEGTGPISRAQDSSVNALQRILNQGPTDIDAFFRDAVQKPLVDEFTRSGGTRDQIGRSLGARGSFFSSDRLDFDSAAFEDLIDSLAGSRSQFAFQSRESDQARKLEAAGILPNVASSRQRALNEFLKAGEVPRFVDTQRQQFAFNEAAAEEQFESSRFSQLAGLITAPIFGIGSEQKPAGLGRALLVGLVGGAAAGLSTPTSSGGASGAGAGAAGAGSAGGASAGAGAAGAGAGSAGSAFAFCWVAAKLFGWFTKDWWAARNWLLHGWHGSAAEGFRALYQQHGRAWSRNPVMVKRLQPLFMIARDRGREMING